MIIKMATRVKVRKVNEGVINPPDMEFVIDGTNGRLHGLQDDLGNGDYYLYVFYNKDFRVAPANYKTTVLKYFYSSGTSKMYYDSQHFMVANDNSYIRISDGALVDSSEALDSNGDLNVGYITEAVYFETMLGDAIADQEEIAAKRKFGLS